MSMANTFLAIILTVLWRLGSESVAIGTDRPVRNRPNWVIIGNPQAEPRFGSPRPAHDHAAPRQFDSTGIAIRSRNDTIQSRTDRRLLEAASA